MKTDNSATDNNVGGKTPEEIKKLFERCKQDTLALIEQLERERDAAVADLKGLGCTYCKRLESPDESMCFDKCVDDCNWEWRGVKEEKDENTREN